VTFASEIVMSPVIYTAVALAARQYPFSCAVPARQLAINSPKTACRNPFMSRALHPQRP
jgi:hypothetical protein